MRRLKDFEASINVAKINLAIARGHAHMADYVDVMQQDRDDYDQPKGLLASKMRGCTAEILYLDQHSTIKYRVGFVTLMSSCYWHVFVCVCAV